MLKSEDSIKGIRINNNIYTLSQYADDTQFFLDGSERSLRSTLRILHKFYLMSGLKINEDKTKALWIGSMANSELKMCNDYNLDWDQNSIKILGVTFDPGILNI